MERPFPPVAKTAVGAPGIVEGTTGADGADSGDAPPTKFATTVKVYEVPFTSPVTTHERVEPFGVVQFLLEGDDVAV
jgi:hypothetical protein